VATLRSTFSEETAVLYVPVGCHSLANSIPRGAAIVGDPALPGDKRVTVYFVDDVEPNAGMLTLADRALCGIGRMMRKAPENCLILPRETLLVVGTVDGSDDRIILTGPQSERVVADWLGMPRLPRAELRETGKVLTGREVTQIEAAGPARLDPVSFQILLERGGVRSEDEEWIGADGRRTPHAEEALIWALEVIAREL
jgi:hypothetical protein